MTVIIQNEHNNFVLPNYSTDIFHHWKSAIVLRKSFLETVPVKTHNTHLITHPHNSQFWHPVPMTEQSRRRLVVSPSPESRGLSLQDGGRGIRRPMGRWNLRRRGSTVTTGLKFAWLPNSFATSSSGTGCAWGWKSVMEMGNMVQVWWCGRKKGDKTKDRNSCASHGGKKRCWDNRIASRMR